MWLTSSGSIIQKSLYSVKDTWQIFYVRILQTNRNNRNVIQHFHGGAWIQLYGGFGTNGFSTRFVKSHRLPNTSHCDWKTVSYPAAFRHAVRPIIFEHAQQHTWQSSKGKSH